MTNLSQLLEPIAEALQANTNTAVTCESVRDLLLNNPNIEELSLYGNMYFGPDGAVRLAEALSTW